MDAATYSITVDKQNVVDGYTQTLCLGCKVVGSNRLFESDGWTFT